MNDLKAIFDFVLTLFKMPITLLGFTFSFWAIIVWTLIATVVLIIIHQIFGGGGE